MSLAKSDKISSTFIWRRIHSLMGLWLVVYLFIHLTVNSQAALWIGDDGAGFIRLVNSLESLPYLQIIEWLLIGIPLLIHGIWGVKRALQAKLNSFGGSGKEPLLTYSRNRAFTWQRLTSWILLVGIIVHVVQMRFLGSPQKVEISNQEKYLTKISFDEGLYTLAPRLHVEIYSTEKIAQLKQAFTLNYESESLNGSGYSEKNALQAREKQNADQEKKWLDALSSFHLKSNEVIAEAEVPGTAILLMVRDYFKSPLMSGLYTIFVLAAAFHAFNGFWTALITWGAILSFRSQKAMIPISTLGVLVLSILGLAAIWGSYFINLRN